MQQQPPITRTGERFQLRLKVITGSSTTRPAGIKNNEFIVRLNAVPEKGKANKALIAYFAKLLHIAKSDCEIIAGRQSRHKIISFPGRCYDDLLKYLF